MSTTGGTEQGTVLVLDDPAAIAKKFSRAVTDSGSEVVRGADKPGVTNLIEILAAVRGVRAGCGRGATSPACATATSRPRSATRSPPGWRRCASVTTELRADEEALEDVLEAGAEKARAIASRDRRGRPRGDGRRAARRPSLR